MDKDYEAKFLASLFHEVAEMKYANPEKTEFEIKVKLIKELVDILDKVYSEFLGDDVSFSAIMSRENGNILLAGNII